MRYKSYSAIIEVDDEAGIIFGRVLGLRDVITFQGETVAEARKSFEDSVDFYLEMCAERGENPEKPFSGKFILRVSPELHRSLAVEAEARETSLNALAETAIERFLGVSSANSPLGRAETILTPRVETPTPLRVPPKKPRKRTSKG